MSKAALGVSKAALGVSEAALRDLFVFDLVFSGTCSSPMVLCPVKCPAEVHFTTTFALRNSTIFGVGD